jgi:hypothetical protein
MKHLTKKHAVIVAAIGSLAFGAAAFAYFTSTGTGSGTATVGTSTAWQVDTVAPDGLPLTPGGATEQTIGYTVTNNSSGNQHLANVNVKVGNTAGDGSFVAWSSGSCSADDFNINGAGAGAAYDDDDAAGNLDAGADVSDAITITMVDTGVNQDDCKDVTVPLYLSAS